MLLGFLMADLRLLAAKVQYCEVGVNLPSRSLDKSADDPSLSDSLAKFAQSDNPNE